MTTVKYTKSCTQQSNIAHCFLIRDVYKRQYQWHEETILITGSIGVAVAPIDGATFEVLYKNADQALYNSKYSGKNGFSFYNEH